MLAWAWTCRHADIDTQRCSHLDMDTFVLTWLHAGMDIQADVDMDMWTWTWPDNVIDMIFLVLGFFMHMTWEAASNAIYILVPDPRSFGCYVWRPVTRYSTVNTVNIHNIIY